MKPAGWIAWNTKEDRPYGAGYNCTNKLYRSEAIAKGAIGPRRQARGIKAVPVYVADIIT